MKSLAPKKHNYDNPFIIHFDIKNDEIIIQYSNNKIVSIPYKKESELEILNTMKEQILFLKNKISVFEQDKKFDTTLITLSSSFALLNGILLTSSIPDINMLNVLCILYSSVIATYFIFKKIHNENAIEDLKKYKYFIEHEEYFKKDIVRRYFDFYGRNLSEDELCNITINDLCNYSLEDLQTIVSEVQKEELTLKKA